MIVISSTFLGVLMVVFFIGFGTADVYGLYLVFFKYQNHPAFQKRNGAITFLFMSMLACIVVFSFIVGSIECFGEVSHESRPTIYRLSWSVIISLGCGYSFLYNVRLWYIYYCMRRAQDMTDWRFALNAEHYQNSWFLQIQNIQRYANPRKLFFFGLGLAIFFAAVNTIATFVISLLAGVIWTVIFAMTTANFMFLFVQKVWKLVDFWKIRKEVLYFKVIETVCTAYVGSLFLAKGLFDVSSESVFVLLMLCGVFCSGSLIILHSILLIKWLDKDDKLYRDKTNYNTRNLLKEILSNKKSYELIMGHLASEFSTENLLFLTEIVELQQFLLQYGYMAYDETYLFCDSPFPDFLKPSIIFSKYLESSIDSSHPGAGAPKQKQQVSSSPSSASVKDVKQDLMKHVFINNIQDKPIDNDAKNAKHDHTNPNQQNDENNAGSYSRSPSVEDATANDNQNENEKKNNNNDAKKNTSTWFANLAKPGSDRRVIEIGADEKYTILCEIYIQLFDKYVSSKAIFQINLPHELQKSLLHFYQHCQIDRFDNEKNHFRNNTSLLQWWSVICSCGKEILTLVKHSQERFHYYEVIRLQMQNEKKLEAVDVSSPKERV